MLDLEERAEHIKDALDQLRTAYEASHAAPHRAGDEPEVEVLDGLEDINAAIGEACDRSQSELRCAQPGGGRTADVLEEAIQRDLRLLHRGVRMRSLYQHAARFSTPTRFYVERVEALGAEVRTIDEFSDRLIIVDHTVAFLPATVDRHVAVAVRQPAVVTFLAGLFDRVWLRAIPFCKEAQRSTVRAAVDSTRRIVARLVVQGDTDSVCARRAGLSLRNYREHVRQLMAQLDARSRSELGYRIAELGILDEADDALHTP
jgi:sugar-specific transcriptional regulator TrmB